MGVALVSLLSIIVLFVIGIELELGMIIEFFGFMANPKFVIIFIKDIPSKISLNSSVMVPVHWDYWC